MYTYMSMTTTIRRRISYWIWIHAKDKTSRELISKVIDEHRQVFDALAKS